MTFVEVKDSREEDEEKNGGNTGSQDNKLSESIVHEYLEPVGCDPLGVADGAGKVGGHTRVNPVDIRVN